VRFGAWSKLWCLCLWGSLLDVFRARLSASVLFPFSFAWGVELVLGVSHASVPAWPVVSGVKLGLLLSPEFGIQCWERVLVLQ
jgi:hypothetical protein